ncbi:hypothetical protein RND81_10G052500 [Saponaria officinalis]|uniref:KHG/KDPG aldolase n=1 Tax=Saponaria officinalis TaxID=3572 RepID=A0AAW1HYC7_SAPOF
MASGKIGLCLSPPNVRNTASYNLKASSCTTTIPHRHSHRHSLCNETLSHLQNSGVIACLRAPSAELALGAARAALFGGIKVLEVVVSTPSLFEVLDQLVKEFPTMTLGVGTILKSEDAKEAIKAGAKFLMSPAMITDVHSDVKDSKVLYIPGVMTPTEILNAYNTGARIVKIYPVSALGGVEYISALKKPFHHIPMVASQGIKIGQVREYITRGASSVVLSDAIFDKEAVAHGNFEYISRQAQLAASTGDEAVKQLKLTRGQ